ncbi:hypothetical protein [Bhargavaea ginsengi]|uniref:hypothetical protein n=1 Tax=Bhargavaea ginsengi TaxID=426757 RepID=UPI003C7292CA
MRIEFDDNGAWFRENPRQAVAAVIEDIAYRIEHEGAQAGAVYDGEGEAVGWFAVKVPFDYRGIRITYGRAAGSADEFGYYWAYENGRQLFDGAEDMAEIMARIDEYLE